MAIGYVRALALLHHTFKHHPITQRLHILGRFFSAPFLRTLDVIPQGARVLDVGAGHGTYARLIAEERAGMVVAIEPDLRKTLLAFPHPRVRFVAGFDDCIRGQFDAVVLYDVVYRLDLPERDALYARLFDRLRPGGLLIVKEIDPTSRLKWRWNRLQETISDAVFHLTIGSGLHGETPDETRERLARAGFVNFSARRIDRRYPHAHVLYVAQRPA